MRVPSFLLPAILYDCSELASSCSACLGASLESGFDCGWCDSATTDSCAVMEMCSDGTLIVEAAGCPNPVITGFTPQSGPPQGRGTTVTITGTDLGVTYEDVVGRVMLTNGEPCVTQEDGYVSGTQIVCVTPEFDASDGEVQFNVTLNRNGILVTAVSDDVFMVLTPSVDEVVPSFGPVSGGSVLSVRGSNLNIGNVEDTRVTLNGEECDTNTE